MKDTRSDIEIFDLNSVYHLDCRKKLAFVSHVDVFVPSFCVCYARRSSDTDLGVSVEVREKPADFAHSHNPDTPTSNEVPGFNVPYATESPIRYTGDAVLPRGTFVLFLKDSGASFCAQLSAWKVYSPHGR